MTAPGGLPGAELRLAQVREIRELARDILGFELVARDGRPLPPFTAGAHVDVHTPSGKVRQYSLCGDPANRDSYLIAVKREKDGRGGSLSMHARIEEGSTLAIQCPRNHFPLADAAESSLFVAGGIGITPIVAMVHTLAAAGRPWTLHYCARSADHAAFLSEIGALPGGTVHTHFSELPILDVRGLLEPILPGRHLYICGPAGLMDAALKASTHWPVEHVHHEYFAAPPPVATSAAPTAFELHLARSGGTLTVPAERSIVQALREYGVHLPTACEEGVCGTCEVAVLDGLPEHRDFILSGEERTANRTLMACVSRARSARLVLDL